MVPIPSTLPLLSQFAPTAPLSVPYYKLTEEEKPWVLFTDGSA